MSVNNIQNFQLSSALAIGYLQFLHTNILFALLSWTLRVIWMVFVVVLFWKGVICFVLSELFSCCCCCFSLLSFNFPIFQFSPFYCIILHCSFLPLSFLSRSFSFLLFSFLLVLCFIRPSLIFPPSFCLFFPSFLTPHSAFYFNSLENTCSSDCIHMLM